MSFTLTGLSSDAQSMFSKLGNDAFKGGFKNPNIASAVGGVIQNFGSFIPEKSVYGGTNGDITRTADSIYDTASDVVSSIPGWGTVAGLAMKGVGALSKGVAALGGGTDGMCVCAGTLIYTKTGKLVPIEKLQPSDGILGWNPSTKQIVPQEITNVITPTEKECIKIILKDGSYLQCSIDHPILSNLKDKAESHRINGKRIAYRNWEFHRADALKIGNWVGKANNIDFWGDIELPQAYLVGMLIGDGTYGKGSSCRIFSADPDTWKYIEENNLGVINHCDDNRPEKYSKEVRTYRIINGMKLMRSLGLVYQTHENKTLPKDIFKYTKDSICKLIAGLYDTDGSISVNTDKSQYSITLYQSNKSLLEEVQTQLYKLGIKSTIGTRKATQYKIGGRICNSKISYRLELIDYRSIQNFYKLIPLNISYKKEALEKIYNLSLTKKVREHSDLSGASQVKIIDIIPLGKQTVYNLTCTPNHTYIANNIITHNTKTDALLGSNFFQLTPMGLINGFFGKRSHTLDNGEAEQEAIAGSGSSYTGSVHQWQDAAKYSNKKYGMFSGGARRRANRKIDAANRTMDVIEGINTTAQNNLERANAMADTYNMAYQMNLNGGYDPTTQIGRNGLKIQYLKRAKKIVNKMKDQKRFNSKDDKLQDKKEISSHKNGGVLTEEFFNPIDWQPTISINSIEKFQNGGSVNVIPDGALHARLHHMEDAKDLTKKGIPVVDNNGNQQAEIERNEIIFRKEVTNKIEELMKDGSDKAAIECGKLLATEIVENTDDKTGLVPELLKKNQLGGTIDQKLLPNGLSFSQAISPDLVKTPSAQDLNNLQTKVDAAEQDRLSKQLEKNAKIVSTLNIANTAMQGIGNAINAGKQQKVLNEANFQKQKDAMIASAGNMDKNAQMYNQLMSKAEKGEKLPEKKYKTYQDWIKYLESTGRKVDPNYDNEGFYNDPDTYFSWQKEEDRNPGKARISDKYKLPTYMTFSTDSKYSTPEETGGTWSYDDNGDIFITSPFLESKHSLVDYLKWLPINDSRVKTLIYKGKSYHIGRKK